MPILRLLTNVEIIPESRPALMARVSRAVAEILGKPESYVMVILESGRDLIFAGTADPAAYLELKSLGLPESRTPAFSHALCTLLADTLGLPPARVYIEFTAPPRPLFGWNGATF